MRKPVLAAAIAGLALVAFPAAAQAGGGGGGGGGCGYNCQTTTTMKYPTTTRPKPTTTVTYPTTSTTKPPHMTTTTTVPESTTSTTMATTTTTVPTIRTLLSLRARVIGGPATPADFDLLASGPIDISGITDNPRVTLALVDPGTYALSFLEDARAMDPYTNSGWACVGSADTTSESVTLDAGEDALCVITFTETATAVTTIPSAITPTTEAPLVEATPAESTPAAVSSGLATTGTDVPVGLGAASFLLLMGGGVVWLSRRHRK
jgi:hypothetical protein